MPAPFGPTTPTRAPSPTVSETPEKISWTPCEAATSTSVIEDMDLLTKGRSALAGAGLVVSSARPS